MRREVGVREPGGEGDSEMVVTEETRPLDGGGLMHLQQTKINDQDSMLKQLSVSLTTLAKKPRRVRI